MDLYPFAKRQLKSSTTNLALNSLMEGSQALEENLNELPSLLSHVLFLKVFKKQNFICNICKYLNIFVDIEFKLVPRDCFQR